MGKQIENVYILKYDIQNDNFHISDMLVRKSVHNFVKLAMYLHFSVSINSSV